MMKKLIVMGIVAMMVMGLSVAAFAAADAAWVVQMRAENSSGQCQSAITLGTKVGAIDGFTTAGSEDATLASPTAGYGEISVTNGATTRISKDYRAPLDLVTNAGAAKAKIWDLVVGINGATAGALKIKAWVPSTTLIDGTDTIIELWVKGQKVWTFAPGASGTSAAPNYLSGLDPFEGGNFSAQLVAYCPGGQPPIVPEPGSMVAMFSGLVGLAGFAIRRRK